MSRVLRIPFLLILLAPLALFFLPEEESYQPPPESPSGAMEALDVWSATRAYPARVMPETGIAAAWAETRQARELRGSGIDDTLNPWTCLGPANIGGRTLALALEPGTPDVIYAGAASGGLWKSTTGGVGADAWDRIVTGFPVTAVSTIAVDAADTDVLFIGTGEVYSYQSSIGGEVDRTTRGSYGIGILKTTDGGGTWAMSLDWTSAQTRGVWAVRIDPSDSDRVFAATTEGIYRSTDAGTSWQQVLNVIMGMDLRIHPTSPDTVLAACGNFGSVGHGVYRSTDGGDSWGTVTGISGGWTGKTQLAIAGGNPSVMYASVGNTFDTRALYRSTDAGATFGIVNSTDYAQYQGWYSHYVAVSDFDEDEIYVGGINIWKSTNGGTSLSQISDWSDYNLGTPPPEGPYGGPDYAHADQHYAIPHPTDPNAFFFASDGGVFRTTNSGSSFKGLNGHYTVTQFYNGFSNAGNDPQLAMGGMQDNFTAIWTGSVAWTRVIGGDGSWTAIHPTDTNRIYGSYQNLNIWISLNGGSSWGIVTPPTTGNEATAFIAPFVLSPADPDLLYAGRAHVYKTVGAGYGWVDTNGGNSLNGSNNPVFALATSFSSPDTAAAATAPVTNRARVFVTANEGGSWSDVTGPLPDRYITDLAFDPSDSRVLYATISGFGASHLWRTTDFGSTWTDAGNGLPDVPTSAVAVDPDLPSFVYVGTDIGTYVSTNAGASWEAFNSGFPPALVNDLKIYAPDRKLRAATHGNGVWERDLPDPSVVGAPVAVGAPAPGLRLAVSPNPLRAGGRVTFELPRPGPVRLDLYDVAGRRVAPLLDEVRSAGAHTVRLDGRRLAAGVYFARLEAAGDVEVTRLVRVR